MTADPLMGLPVVGGQALRYHLPEQSLRRSESSCAKQLDMFSRATLARNECFPDS